MRPEELQSRQQIVGAESSQWSENRTVFSFSNGKVKIHAFFFVSPINISFTKWKIRRSFDKNPCQTMATSVWRLNQVKSRVFCFWHRSSKVKWCSPCSFFPFLFLPLFLRKNEHYRFLLMRTKCHRIRSIWFGTKGCDTHKLFAKMAIPNFNDNVNLTMRNEGGIPSYEGGKAIVVCWHVYGNSLR